VNTKQEHHPLKNQEPPDLLNQPPAFDGEQVAVTSSHNIPSIFSNSSFTHQVNECNNLALGPKSVPDFGKVNLLAAKKSEEELAQFPFNKKEPTSRSKFFSKKLSVESIQEEQKQV